jgi:hypothetical protein
VDQFEQLVVLECYHALHRFFWGSEVEAARHLRSIDPKIALNLAQSVSRGAYVTVKARERIAAAALRALRPHFDNPPSDVQFSSDTLDYLRTISSKESGKETPLSAASFILSNSKATKLPAKRPFRSGIYQIFRRYKPPLDQTLSREESAYWLDETNHSVVCELLYIDGARLECLLITSEGNCYLGSLLVTHEKIMFGQLQRRVGQEGEVNQRFLALSLERTILSFYSGLIIKVGDTLHRPLASECFFVPLTKEDNAALYSKIGEVRKAASSAANWKNDEIIADYITDSPPNNIPYNKNDPRWKRVKFVRDFPWLIEAVTGKKNNRVLFREPSRTLSVDSIVSIAQAKEVKEFRHSANHSSL